MNFRGLSLFLCLCTLMPLIIVGLSIRTYFDNSDYKSMIISLAVACLLLYVAKYLFENSEKPKDGNGGLKIRLT